MTAACLLDTSFLITLVDDRQQHHAVARAYFEQALQQGVLMHVSTIALAEFAIKQAITDLPLQCFLIVPFNVSHAVLAGRLAAELLPSRDASDDRTATRASRLRPSGQTEIRDH